MGLFVTGANVKIYLYGITFPHVSVSWLATAY